LGILTALHLDHHTEDSLACTCSPLYYELVLTFLAASRMDWKQSCRAVLVYNNMIVVVELVNTTTWRRTVLFQELLRTE